MIGAHGRLKNLLSKRQLDVSAVRILVFDEADQMLEVSHLSLMIDRAPTGICVNETVHVLRL